jgi:hypothetical protein
VEIFLNFHKPDNKSLLKNPTKPAYSLTNTKTGTQQAGQIAALKMESRHRKPNDDELEDDEYIEEHNDDDEMMLTLPSVA